MTQQLAAPLCLATLVSASATALYCRLVCGSAYDGSGPAMDVVSLGNLAAVPAKTTEGARIAGALVS